MLHSASLKDGVNGEKGYSVRLTESGISINGELELEIDAHLMAIFNHMKEVLNPVDRELIEGADGDTENE